MSLSRMPCALARVKPSLSRRSRSIARVADANDVDPLGLPITYTASPRERKDLNALCDASDASGEETCSIVDASEVYDTRCRACRGAKMVKTTYAKGQKVKTTTSTCQTCGGAGVVRVASSRVRADYARGDSEAAMFEKFPTHEKPRKKLETRVNPFYKFEKEVEARRSADEDEETK